VKHTTIIEHPTAAALGPVCEKLRGAERLLITCHIKPDGDALGSMLALGLAFKARGREVTLYSEEPVPNLLRFLPGADLVVCRVADPLPEDTTLVVLDCNEPQRIGREAQRLIDAASSIVVLDHHLSRTPPFWGSKAHRAQGCCVSYVLPEIFATGAIVFWVLRDLGWTITPDVATNLYTAILSDTGCFRHSNTTKSTFEMAAFLVESGADPHGVAVKLYQNCPVRRQRLLALILQTLELHGGGRVGLLLATAEMFRQAQAAEEDAEDFVAYARCIDSVEVAVFIKETQPGRVSVSLRSKSAFNVADFARTFGGGGHFHAAGFRAPGTAPEIRDAVLERLGPVFPDRGKHHA